MKLGRVCGKHNQWCPDGECPYCPTAPVDTAPAVVVTPPMPTSNVWPFATLATYAHYIVQSNGVPWSGSIMPFYTFST